MFQVIAAEKAVSLAYSTRSLPLHMDLPSYESFPGLQLLHCIRYAVIQDMVLMVGESLSISQH